MYSPFQEWVLTAIIAVLGIAGNLLMTKGNFIFCPYKTVILSLRRIKKLANNFDIYCSSVLAEAWEGDDTTLLRDCCRVHSPDQANLVV